MKLFDFHGNIIVIDSAKICCWKYRFSKNKCQRLMAEIFITKLFIMLKLKFSENYI